MAHPTSSLTSDLAEHEPEQPIVSQHPAAIAGYQSYVENLSQAFDDGISTGNADAAAAIRDLVEKVIVGHDADGKLELPVHGRLATLTEALNLCPNMRIPASGSGGSGGGTRTPDTWIMIPLL